MWPTTGTASRGREEADERREQARRKLDEHWIDVGAFKHNIERDRYEWYDSGWRNWLLRKLQPLRNSSDSISDNDGSGCSFYWWPLAAPLPANALRAKRLHVLYRRSDRRIVQFIAFEYEQ